MRIVLMVIMGVCLAAGAWAGSVGNAVEVRISADTGRDLPLYPAPSRPGSLKVYAEAVRGEQYSITVHNRLDRRIGLVLAVDGRNIISGKKSWLRNGERMYILEPYETGEYKGWRTAGDRINRFYFTAAADSYAAAFSDQSSMGVIALAVYPEVRRLPPPAELSESAPAATQRDAAGAAAAPRAKAEAKSAGTGYGRPEYSPSRVVAFEPEGGALEKIYVRYEWRETLCRQGIIDCRPAELPNRLWDNDGYAPPPPDRR